MIMKKINKYVSLFVAVVIAFTLVGCTSDDDIGISYSDYQNSVVGEWYVTHRHLDNLADSLE